ncbi:TPA: GGDEF domain-containing protein [Salmonella enterica]|uniref:diguanylate cyclase n=1 Tax=Salmonella enterica TaxID=28901 RepID=A0A5Z8LJ21_SALER|nr:GGDEF domain-containing protein [Salmonella enterica]EBD3365013.1 GGDEF domain-containing protein [Salmonella enterica subsp. enterica serovar Bareilly]EBP3741970.1 diguanylate cyclase [Salmonella enterica subsp. enterica]EBZ0659884.1 GGDEF domain-containing protein [Salmonella enterica subsp. enterica serovar Haifa]ECI0937500.1 diguanylate cyclase [Salmonella enterica subsp. enterica serovar Typhimurium]ECT9349444.1 GGDEF domain-containing protein [Salmonella enterica subsp. enterica serov
MDKPHRFHRYRIICIVVSMIVFLLLSIITCGLYSMWIKERISAVKVALIDHGLAIANVSEYRRNFTVNMLSSIVQKSDVAVLQDLLRETNSTMPPPPYLYYIETILMHEGRCYSIQLNDNSICNNLMSSLLFLQRFNSGFIRVKGIVYEYYVHLLSAKSNLLFLLRPERHLNRLRIQNEDNDNLLMAIFYRGKLIAGDKFKDSDAVFSKVVSTQGFAYMPNSIYYFAYKKDAFIKGCFLLVFISGVIAAVFFMFCNLLITNIIARGYKEKRVIVEGVNTLPIEDGLFFNETDMRKIQSIYHSTIFDELTGAYGRKSFDDDIQELIKQKGSLCLFDVDKFKSINDGFGHLFGDEVLKRVVSIVREKIIGGRVYRFGGDEFAVIFYGNNFSELLNCMKGLTSFYVGGCHCSCSIGIAKTDECDTAASLKRLADKRLYNSKENGRAMITWY